MATAAASRWPTSTACPGDTPHIETVLEPGELITARRTAAAARGRPPALPQGARPRLLRLRAGLGGGGRGGRGGRITRAALAFGGLAHMPWRDRGGRGGARRPAAHARRCSRRLPTCCSREAHGLRLQRLQDAPRPPHPDRLAARADGRGGMSDTGATGWLNTLGLGGLAGTANALTMDEPYPTSLLDSGAQELIGRPLDRIDGPLKVAGARDLCRRIRLRRSRARCPRRRENRRGQDRVGRRRQRPSDARRDRRRHRLRHVHPGARSRAARPRRRRRGSRTITYRGQIVAIVVAETFEAARDAARQLPHRI